MRAFVHECARARAGFSFSTGTISASFNLNSSSYIRRFRCVCVVWGAPFHGASELLSVNPIQRRPTELERISPTVAGMRFSRT